MIAILGDSVLQSQTGGPDLTTKYGWRCPDFQRM
jgi:hypothetical protein